MSADVLREAATLMRLRAEKAIPGPWRYNPAKHHHWPGSPIYEESVFAGPAGLDAVSIAGTGPSDDPQSMADAAHIASWHPAVALAVADWLDRSTGQLSDPYWRAELHPALTVARAYLGRNA